MNFLEIPNNLHFEASGKAFFRKINDFYFSLELNNDINGNYILISTTINTSFDQSIKNELRRITTYPIRLSTFNITNDTISLYVSFPFGVSEKTIDKIEKAITLFSEELSTRGYVMRDVCPVCKEKAEPIAIGSHYLPIHEECKAKFKEKLITKLNKTNEKVSNLPISIIFSFIGGFIGLIPTILTITTLQMTYALLFALVPFCSFFGYKLGRAPRKVYSTIIVIIISTLFVLGLELFMWNLVAQNEFISLISCIKKYSLDFFKEVGMALLFLLIGVFISWRYISNTTDKEKIKIDKM